MKKILSFISVLISLNSIGQQIAPGSKTDDTVIHNGFHRFPNTPAGVGTKAVRMDASGKIFIADTATGLASNVSANTYTPTLTNGANVTASTAHVWQYSAVTDPTSGLIVVTVSGYLEIDPTLTATATTLTASLPICSSFTNEEQAGGVFFCSAIAGLGGGIYTANGTSTVIFSFVTTDVNNNKFRFIFTYKVIGC